MCPSWLLGLLPLLVFVPACNAAEDPYLVEFRSAIENLLLSSTDKALNASIAVYRNISALMPPRLLQAAEPLMQHYIEVAQQALGNEIPYSNKTLIIKYYRINNWKIERMRRKFAPKLPKFNFQVLSEDFYKHGKNSTLFDGIFLEFMVNYEKAFAKLKRNLSLEVKNNEEDLLQLLYEIEDEQNIEQKGQLYDELTYTFLFQTTEERLETRELE